MYIGLKQTKENKDGSVSDSMVAFDPTLINAKVDYFANGILQGRVDLQACTDQLSFDASISNS